MKKIVWALCLKLLIWGSFYPSVAMAERNVLPLPTTLSSDTTEEPKELYDSILQHNIIADQVLKAENGTENVLKIIFRGGTGTNGSDIIFTINIILGTIAVFYFAFLGAEFIVARGDQEKLAKHKEQFGWMIMGLLIISIAEFIAFDIWDPVGNRDVLTDSTLTTNLENKIQQLKLFVEILIGGIMLVRMMMSGYNLITGSESDENIEREKTFLKAFFLGGALILMAEIFTRLMVGGLSSTDNSILTEPDTAQSATRIITEVVGMINFTLSFIAVASVLMMILASLYYVISFGSEDQMNRAKRMIYSCIFASIVATASFTIVRFVVN